MKLSKSLISGAPVGPKFATDRYCSGLSAMVHVIELEANSKLVRPKSLEMRTAIKPMIWQDAVSDFGRTIPLNCEGL